MSLDAIFEGIGTMLVGLIIGSTGVGALWYRSSHKAKQKQAARDNSNQIQIGRDYNGK